MSQLLTLNGIPIKQPDMGNFTINRYVLSNAGRTADGSMQADIIARKRKFNLKWGIIKASDWETILSVLGSGDFFFDFGYVEDDISYVATCYAGDVKATQFRTDSGWYWTDAQVDFIEQ